MARKLVQSNGLQSGKEYMLLRKLGILSPKMWKYGAFEYDGISSWGEFLGLDSLATKCPKLYKEWHPTKNGELTPSDVAPGSHKKVWWLCSKCKHEWQTGVRDRVRGGCIACRGFVATKNNCLATLNPKLAKEWHPTKNSDTPYDVVPGSSKKRWWICSACKHEWEAVLCNRRERGCPACRGLVATKNNCLAALSPKLAKEWHPTKNGNLKPQDVTMGSGIKVWWKCLCMGHEWNAAIYSRTTGNGCSACSGQTTTKGNCLATLNPKLAKEWHPTKNGELTPFDVTPGSNKKAWWLCSKCKYEWQIRPANRTIASGCPACSCRVATKSNCLATLNPKLAKEWHPIKNGELTPFDVVPGAGKKVWWLCSKSKREWQARVVDRVVASCRKRRKNGKAA